MEEGEFIVVEGPEGAGKSTLAQFLANLLEESGISATLGREPGGTELGERVRRVVLDADLDPCERTTLFLMLTARSAFVEQLVKPTLEKGHVFISDRFDLSTLVYQIAASGLPEEKTIFVNDFAKDYITPDLNIVLLVDPEEGLYRKRDDEEKDRMELKNLKFHKKVAEGYRKFSKRAENTFVVNTNDKSIEEVKQIIVEELNRRFSFGL